MIDDKISSLLTVSHEPGDGKDKVRDLNLTSKLAGIFHFTPIQAGVEQMAAN